MHSPIPTLIALISQGRQLRASDLILSPDKTANFCVNGVIVSAGPQVYSGEEVMDMLGVIAPTDYDAAAFFHELSFARVHPDFERLRVHAARIGDSALITIRFIPTVLPAFNRLRIDRKLLELIRNRGGGLILVSGPTGAGKSTTIAALVEDLNTSMALNIISIEEPIEFVHTSRKSLIHQREVPHDVPTFSAAIISAMRQAPHVLVIGEMRDPETYSAALNAADSGHLVLASMHARSASDALSRILGSLPAAGRDQARLQLASSLLASTYQLLLPGALGERVLAQELLINTPAVANLIRENNLHQLESTVISSSRDGMIDFDASLSGLRKRGEIDLNTARAYARVPDRVS